MSLTHSPPIPRRARGRVLPRCALLAASLLALASCATPPGDEDAPPPMQSIAFEPIVPSSQLHLDQGRYPNLFTAATKAVWMNLAPNAGAMSGGVAILECTLESAFSDMSIGYDVVGFRGIQAYLLLPDGTHVAPAQINVGKELSETQRGTLKVFGRTNHLLFSKQALNLTVPRAEGHDSAYYFEWFPRLPEPAIAKDKDKEKQTKAWRRKGNRIGQRVRAWARNFQ